MESQQDLNLFTGCGLVDSKTANVKTSSSTKRKMMKSTMDTDLAEFRKVSALTTHETDLMSISLKSALEHCAKTANADNHKDQHFIQELALITDLGAIANEQSLKKPMFNFATKFGNFGFLLYPPKDTQIPNWSLVRSVLTTRLVATFGTFVKPDWIKTTTGGYTNYDLMACDVTMSDMFKCFNGIRYKGFYVYPYFNGHKIFCELPPFHSNI